MKDIFLWVFVRRCLHTETNCEFVEELSDTEIQQNQGNLRYIWIIKKIILSDTLLDIIGDESFYMDMGITLIEVDDKTGF